jgi:hypothetical protein
MLLENCLSSFINGQEVGGYGRRVTPDLYGLLMNRLFLALLALLTGLGAQLAPGEARACETSAVGAGLLAAEAGEALVATIDQSVLANVGGVEISDSQPQVWPSEAVLPRVPVLTGIDRARE